jgi:hypothetical protein
MNWKLGAKAAALVGGAALAASPALAQMHGFGGHGGGGHFGGGGAARSGGGFHGGTGGGFRSGPMAGAFAGRTGGTWHGGTWTGGGAWHDHDGDGGRRWRGGWGGFWGPGWGWGDPFLWGGLGFATGYALAPDYGYYDDTYDTPYGAPYDYAPAALPPGYDCDGWRWEPAQNRYVPAKVACQ